MNVKVKYLNEALDEKIEEVEITEPTSAELEETLFEDEYEDESGEEVIIKKTLFSFRLPDGITCSWSGCKIRWREHGVYLKVSWPRSVGEAANNKINNSVTVAIGAAMLALKGTGVLTAGNMAAAAAAAGAAFAASIAASITDPSLLSILKYHIKYDSRRV